jgi:hypothetical protein
MLLQGALGGLRLCIPYKLPGDDSIASLGMFFSSNEGLDYRQKHFCAPRNTFPEGNFTSKRTSQECCGPNMELGQMTEP